MPNEQVGQIVLWRGDYFLMVPDNSSAAMAFEITWPNAGFRKGVERHLIRISDGRVFCPPEDKVTIVQVVMVP